MTRIKTKSPQICHDVALKIIQRKSLCIYGYLVGYNLQHISYISRAENEYRERFFSLKWLQQRTEWEL